MFGVVPCTEEEAAHDRAHHHVDVLVGVRAPSISAVDHRKHLDQVVDQFETNACVAHWFSSANYLAGQAQGRPAPRTSRKWSYDVARYMQTPGVLLDIGSSARLMCLGTARHGMISEARLPFEPSRVNEPPPFDADVAGADALFRDYFRADADAGQLRRALAAGEFPGTAIRVYQNFLDWGSDPDAVYDQPAGDFKGLHMLTAIGFAPGKILYLNSWGPTWGMGGFVWLSDRFVESDQAFDRYVVRSTAVSR